MKRSIFLHARSVAVGLALATLGAGAAAACVTPTFVTDNLNSNFSGNLAADTLQITTFYDGGTPANVYMGVEYRDVNNATCWLWLMGLSAANQKIDTAEYRMNGAQLTGRVSINGTSANGSVDGLGFGFLLKDATGLVQNFHSNATAAGSSHFIGMWTLAMSDNTFTARTPQITNGHSRRQARAMISGSALLRNGIYRIF